MQGYKAQAGAYADLLETGDGGKPCWIDSYQPSSLPLPPPMDSVSTATRPHTPGPTPGTYLAHSQANPF